MHVASFVVNPFQTNTFVCHSKREAILIDPGSYSETERNAVLEYIEKEGLVLRQVILTHGHLDHIFDLAYFSERLDGEYQMHREDLPLIENAESQAMAYGLRLTPPPMPSSFLEEGDSITFGDAVWEVLHTPGHSPGSISLVDRANDLVLSGDVLFRGSVGRTDLWEGSMEILMNSIRQKLLPLPDHYRVLCGHGPETTVGTEREGNPFLLQLR